MHFLEQYQELQNYLAPNSIVLCDENTAKHCFPKLNLDLPLITIPAGEPSKNLNYCDFIWSELIRLGADRQSSLVCLGGGMICDLGAFCASTYQRGIDFVLIPTSLLAMTDAAIGGKCGVDYKHLKNYIGLFSEGQASLICPAFLESLPAQEWVNGYAEMIKHGLICNKDHFNQIISLIESGKEPTIEHIQASIEIKLKHTTRDYREKGIRKRLNFGHTIGHAIESASLQKANPIMHGQAVIWGMLAESYLSHQYWSMGLEELEEIESAIQPLLNNLAKIELDPDALLQLMQLDKKNNAGQVQFVLLNHIGSAQENIPLNAEQIQDGMRYLARFT